MDYFVLDVETANRNRASICQIGFIRISEGKIVEEFSQLINPECEFHYENIRIHKISPGKVKDSPTFPEVWKDIGEHFNYNYVFHYGVFDQSAITQALNRYQLPPSRAIFTDIIPIAHEAWPDLEEYGLASVMKYLGLKHSNHHDALADSHAAYRILTEGLATLNPSVESLSDIILNYKPIKNRNKKPSKSTKNSYFGTQDNTYIGVGNPSGPFYGRHICFTGDFSEEKYSFEKLAFEAGFTVCRGWSKKINVLVVADFDRKTSKQRSAEEALASGATDLKLINESQFLAYLENPESA